ncbi:MAG: hypothetical protein P8126_04760 [Gammaproteobacteria bacterium]
MYQWVDPATGITQLSGKPPPWYRSGEGGPRVFVFEHGRVIDDTGIKVPASEREQLRRQALLDANRKTQKTDEALLDARRLQDAMKQEEDKQPPAENAAPQSGPTAGSRPPPKRKPAKSPPSTAQEKAMKAVISRWEKSRTDQAKEIIGNQSAAPDAAPPPPPTQP